MTTGLIATCTPNSQPHEDGRVEHGYQLNVLDPDLAIVATVDLPDWDRFRPDEIGEQLAGAGFVLSDRTEGWSPSGLGHMAPVVPAAAV